MADDAARFVGDIPHHYDTGLGPVLFEHYARLMAERVAALEPARVLETAAGTGIVSAALAAHLPDAELLVTDLNGPMLEVARGKVDVRVEEADAQALPYPDASFDVVVCQFGLMFLPDLPAGLAEARRVLRAGGSFLFSTWDAHAHNRFAALVDDLLGQEFGADKPPFYEVPFCLHSVDDLRAALAEAGYGEVVAEVLPHRSTVDSWAEFARGVVRGNPVSAQITARGGDLAGFEATLRATFEEAFGPAPTSLPLQALFFTARPA